MNMLEPPQTIGGIKGDPVIVAIRQAFNEGLARHFLESAWMELDQVRQKTSVWRLFRGRRSLREGMPLSEIALRLGRDVGVVGRWFRGETADWANLLLAMIVLNAEWKHLGMPPKKREAKIAGSQRAMAHISRKLLDQPFPNDADGVPPPTSREIECLDELFSEDPWTIDRNDDNCRRDTLERVASRLKIDWTHLDSLDRQWGSAWAMLLKTYLDSVDHRLWE